LGGLNASSAEEIWNGEAYVLLRRSLLENRPLGGCVECLSGSRDFTDHVKPFANEMKAGRLILSEVKKSNFERARQNYLDGKEIVDHLPYVIFLDVSSQCNIRCRKCFVYACKEPMQLGHMAESIFEKIVPLLPTAIRVICTGIGESLVHPNFIRFAKQILAYGCQLSFNTNGLLLTPAVSRQLVECRASEIIFSIDSLNEERYRYLHRGSSLQTVLDNLNAIAGIKHEMQSMLPRLCWFIVGMRSNLPELADVIRKAASLQFQAIYVAQLVEPRHGYKQDYFDFYAEENMISTEEDRQQLKAKLADSRDLARQLGINFGSGYDPVLQKTENI